MAKGFTTEKIHEMIERLCICSPANIAGDRTIDIRAMSFTRTNCGKETTPEECDCRVSRSYGTEKCPSRISSGLTPPAEASQALPETLLIPMTSYYR